LLLLLLLMSAESEALLLLLLLALQPASTAVPLPSVLPAVSSAR
jgi:hypothetical protein